MTKKVFVSIIVICIFFLTGCSNDATNNSGNTGLPSTDEQIKNCSRSAEGTDGVTAKSEYNIYHIGSYITRIHSIVEVNTNSKVRLNEERLAYEKAFSVYDSLDYYDYNITVNGNTLRIESTIDYKNIDIDKLLKIEGESNNIIRNGRAVLAEWEALAKKTGVTCS